ncbi:AAA family ATPase [Priestia megaterium]|uniref:AAA family ATPase n=1 Tax=Priestia megaterium TaxID=1404 RepID=UPI0035D79013
MNLTNNKKDLYNVLKGNYPLIYIVAKDERPVIQDIKEFIGSTGEEYDFYAWDFNKKQRNIFNGSPVVRFKEKPINSKEKIIPIGFMDSQEEVTKKEKKKEQEKLEYGRVIETLTSCDNNRIQLLLDFHKRIETGDVEKLNKIIRAMKDFAYESIFPFTNDYHMPVYRKNDAKAKRSLVLVSSVLTVPKELENLIHIVYYDNPKQEDVRKMLSSYIKQENIILNEVEQEKIIEAGMGLSESEIMLSIKKSHYLNDKKTIKANDIREDKIQIIRKKGSLEFLDVNLNRNSLGGFNELFPWMEKRKLLFKESVRQKYNLDYPKGVMLTGIQGCGKSLAARVIASELDVPMLRLDMGSMYGTGLGESDQNFRNALKTAEQMAPCVLWLDEIEKALSVGQNAHGATKRMFGYFLTWMQEKKEPVFLVATANNIEALSPEFMRKGRFDEIWFVDLPTLSERKEIFNVHFKKKNITFEDADLEIMATETEGYSGAEIETAVNESVLTSILEVEENCTLETVINEVRSITPLSVTHSEKLNQIRKWATEHQVRSVSSSNN